MIRLTQSGPSLLQILCQMLALKALRGLTRICAENKYFFSLYSLLLQEVGVLEGGHKFLQLLGASSKAKVGDKLARIPLRVDEQGKPLVLDGIKAPDLSTMISATWQNDAKNPSQSVSLDPGLAADSAPAN